MPNNRNSTFIPPRDEDMERRMGAPGTINLESLGGPGPVEPGRRMFVGGPPGYAGGAEKEDDG